jgi:ribosome maturation factor RimP
MSKNATIVEQVLELMEPILEDSGFELVDVEYLMEHGRWVLRLYIDTEAGVTLDECARVSREMGDLMDVHDVIPHRYVLEVSSPGLNRPLRKQRDFARVVGKRIKVRTTAPIEGRRNFKGTLTGLQEAHLVMETDGQDVILPLSEVEKANLVYEFDS